MMHNLFMKTSKKGVSKRPLNLTILVISVCVVAAGIYFGKHLSWKNQKAVVTNNQNVQTKKDCGQIPQVAQDFVTKSQQIKTVLPILQGPDWSYDCRYIAITIQDENRNSHLRLYRTQNNKIEEIKAPRGASTYSGMSHTKWFPNGCLETEISVNGVSGLTKIYYNPGQGFASSSQC